MFFNDRVTVPAGTPTRLVESAPRDRTALFRTPTSLVWLGYDASVSSSTGFGAGTDTGVLYVPLPAGMELWVYADGAAEGVVMVGHAFH